MLTRIRSVLAGALLAPAIALAGATVANASTTQPLATIPFADGTSASVSMTVDSPGPSQHVQAFVFTIPDGHSITVNILNGNGDIVVETVTQAGPVSNLSVSVPNRPVGKNAVFQMQVNSQ